MTTYLKEQVDGMFESKCSPALHDKLLHVGDFCTRNLSSRYGVSLQIIVVLAITLTWYSTILFHRLTPEGC